MAAGYVHQGHSLTVVAPYAVTVGNGVKVGNIFGIASKTALIGENIEAQVTGVFDTLKDTSTFASGDYVYWNDSTKRATSNSSAHMQIGVVELSTPGGTDAPGALAGDATVRVRLSAAFLSGMQIGSVAPGTNGQLWVGQTGTDPAFETVSGVITMSAAGVTALAGNVAKGTIQLPIDGALVIGSNDIANTPHVSKNTDPILERENGATDKALRLSWAAASVLEVQLPQVTYPADLDDAAAVVVHILAKMKAASVDTPVIAVGAFEGIGDTNAGGNTAALSTTLQHLTVSIALGDVGPYPTTLALTLKPGTHATSANDVYVYGVWLEYTRKA